MLIWSARKKFYFYVETRSAEELHLFETEMYV